MYKVVFLLEDYVLSKWFKKFEDAAIFAIKQPSESILEIKLYDNQTNHIQDRTHDSR